MSLGLAIVLNVILFALILIANRQLEEAIANTPEAGPLTNALILPVIGLVAWLVGGALGAFFYFARNEAPIAYIVWGAVVLIELATWVPALALMIDV